MQRWFVVWLGLLIAPLAGATDAGSGDGPVSPRSELLLVWKLSALALDTREDLQLVVFRNGAAHATWQLSGLTPRIQRILEAEIPVEEIRELERALRRAGIARLSGGFAGQVTASFLSYPPDWLVRVAQRSPALRVHLRAALQPRINEFSIDVLQDEVGAELNEIVEAFIAEWFPGLRPGPR
jgi:hypothetical protein